jgi:hypothetical protein
MIKQMQLSPAMSTLNCSRQSALYTNSKCLECGQRVVVLNIVYTAVVVAVYICRICYCYLLLSLLSPPFLMFVATSASFSKTIRGMFTHRTSVLFHYITFYSQRNFCTLLDPIILSKKVSSNTKRLLLQSVLSDWRNLRMTHKILLKWKRL